MKALHHVMCDVIPISRRDVGSQSDVIGVKKPHCGRGEKVQTLCLGVGRGNIRFRKLLSHQTPKRMDVTVVRNVRN
jgi:hypothetical protein